MTYLNDPSERPHHHELSVRRLPHRIRRRRPRRRSRRPSSPKEKGPRPASRDALRHRRRQRRHRRPATTKEEGRQAVFLRLLIGVIVYL